MIQFIKQFIKHPTKVGAILPSSGYLARRMVEDIDFYSCKNIVEYGPGTGVFTREIIRKKHLDTKFLIIEQNVEFYNLLVNQYGQLPNVFLVNGSVEEVEMYLRKYHMPSVDVIISGIPFTSLPKKVTNIILSKTTKILTKEGRFITFQYSLVKKHIFEKFFKITECKKERINIPPAYVLVMNKRTGLE